MLDFILGALPIVVGVGVAILAALIFVFTWMAWRRVVETNYVHIVQSKKKTTSFGAGKDAGNVYLKVPASIPLFGVNVIELPVSNFNEQIDNYLAYDKDRVPFSVDVAAFFRIADTDKAASRISSFTDLQKQLLSVVKGAIRKVLGTHDIHQIMTDRATFGEAFTKEVSAELAAWGVEPVKSLELMDLRDAEGSKVIANIQAMKSSQIEMESRTTVALNKQKAQTAEIENQKTIDTNKIEAEQTVALRKQEQEQTVGIRTAEQTRTTGLAQEQAAQEVQAAKAITTQREMQTLSVDTIRRAEIDREAKLINADAVKQAALIKAEQDKQTVIISAEAKAEAAAKEAQSVTVAAEADATSVRVKGEAAGAAVLANGTAVAESERLLKMAATSAELALAAGIGAQPEYQNYLVNLETVRVNGEVGKAQAEALGKSLAKADIKVIANNNNAADGLNSLSEIFTSGGGLKIGSLFEGLKNTPQGAALMEGVAKLVNNADSDGKVVAKKVTK
jgi:flotillin